MAEVAHYAVIGDPVEHSLSPLLFNAVFQRLGLAADYGARRVAAHELSAAIEALRQGAFHGYSVTLPHKEAARDWVDEVDGLAARIGAVNCIKRVDQRLKGFNTDAWGLRKALERHGCSLHGAQVLVLGAGGVGRAAAYTAVEYGVSRLVVANRSMDRAVALTDTLASRAEWDMDVHAVALDDSLQSTLAEVDVVINATSVGLLSKHDPLPASCQLEPRHLVMDLVYRPVETPLLKRAAQAGAQAVDGLWMLIYQALAQLELWTGVKASDELVNRLYPFLRKAA